MGDEWMGGWMKEGRKGLCMRGKHYKQRVIVFNQMKYFFTVK